tara:strand:+ start:488 stop:1390 length:903 start_codon:yes stop_codon:yes gene_type:complete
MGWFSDLFGSDDAPATTTTTSSSTQIPEYIEKYTQEQLAAADKLGQTPFASFPDQLVNPFNATQQAAFDANTANQGAWQPGMDAANAAMNTGTNTSFTGSVQDYMNPYSNNVKAGINQSFDEQQLAQNAATAQSGALGGDRRGIYDAQLAGERARTMGEVDAASYDQAQRAFFDDMTRKQQGGAGLAQLGQQYQNQLGTDVATQAQYGNQQQQLGQANIDANYSEFMREQQHPFEMFNVRQSALSGLPYSTTSTGTQTNPGAAGATGMQNLTSTAGIVGGLGGLFSADMGGTSAWKGMFS